MNYIIPIIVLFIIVYSFFKKVNIYDEFLVGAKEGLITIFNITPAILAFVFAVNIFTNSNLITYIFSIFKLNIPTEVISMMILRPVSGNATLALLNTIYKLYGPDSYPGFLASIIEGCTDTTIYVLALYFSSIKIKKTRYALKVGLFADLCGITAAIILSYFFFK